MIVKDIAASDIAFNRRSDSSLLLSSESSLVVCNNLHVVCCRQAVCTNEEKNYPVLIENHVMADVRPLSPVTTQKPATMELDAVHECAAVPLEFSAEVVLKRPPQSPCNRVTEDVTSERPAGKDAVGLADGVVNPSAQRASDNVSVDPQLHLLDFQLRHILKPSPSARDEGSSAAADFPSMKTKNAVEGSPSRSFAHSRDHNGPAGDQQCTRKPPHSGSVRCEMERMASGGRSDGSDHWSGAGYIEGSRTRPSRSVERGRRPSYGRRDVNEDAMSQPVGDRGDAKMLSADAAAGSGGIIFGGVEELSHGNVPAEDLPTTNIYLDDHATKAAPYTIASQFYSLGSEADDDAGSEVVPDKKMDDDGVCNVSPSACNTADKPRRPVTLTRPSLSSAERPSEQPGQQYDTVWRRCSSANPQFTTSAIVSRALSINGPISADAFPRPKFSVRSPSSPARLATSDIVTGSKPRQINVEPAEKEGVVSNVSPPREDSVPAAPLAAQEPDCSDANSASDIEAGVFTAPSGDKVAPVDVVSDLRGTADGESPRIPCEVVDGRGGDAVQQSEISDRISSCSADLAAITSCQHALQMNMFARPNADFPDISRTSKVVPMAVAKKIADCLDVSLGSDKEVKEIMRNGEAAVDRVDRTMSAAPTSRFAVVSKTVVGCFESSNRVPNSATAKSEHAAAVNVDSISVPRLPDSVPASHVTVSDVRTYASAAGQQSCLSAVAHSRLDDVSDTGSSLLVKTETFSSPDCLPRPPSSRVSKKAAIANRARYVFAIHLKLIFPFKKSDFHTCGPMCI